MKKRLFRNRRTRYAGISAVLTVLVITVVILVNSVFGSLASRYHWVTSMNAKANYDVTGVCYDLLDRELAEIDATERDANVRVIFCDTEAAWSEDETQSYLLHTAKSICDRYDRLTIEFYDTRLNPTAVRPYATNQKTGESIPVKESSVIIVCEDYHRVYNLEEFFVFKDNANTNVWAYKGERTLATGILRALNRDVKVACITSNHGEAFTDYEIAYLLDDAGYDVRSDFDLSTEEIPEKCSLILTYNPNSDLDVSVGIEENRKLDEFLAKEGNAFLVFLSTGTPQLANLEAYLNGWGVKSGVHVDPANGKSYRYTVQDSAQSLTSDGYTIYGNLSSEATARQMFSSNESNVVFKNATALGHASDFVANGDGTYSKGDSRKLYSIYEASEDAVLWANGVARDGDSSMLMTLTEQKHTSGRSSYVGVVASSDFASRDQLQSAVYRNSDVLYRLLSNVSGEYSIEGLKLKPFASTEISTITTAQMLRWTICLTVIPAGLVAVTGIVILIRRRRA